MRTAAPKEPSTAQSMAILLIAITVVVAGAVFFVKRLGPPSASAVAAASSSAVAQAASEFETVARDYRYGTSKLYSRVDFLPLDDPRAMSTGDFIGRLRALFGPSSGNEYVLRHRKTGFIITAYSAQSGPSYGGGPRFDGALPEAGWPSHLQLLADGEERARRLAADAIVAKGRPLGRSKRPLESYSAAELKELRQQDHDWMKHSNDVAAPEGFAVVAARLDELVSAVPPADWETTSYDSDTESVYREGCRQGEPFSDDLAPSAGIDFLLHEGETSDAGGGGPFNRDYRAVKYWLHHATRGERVESALPRVRAAWLRWAASLAAESPELRTLLVRGAEDDAVTLGIDRAKAAEALR